MRAGGQFATESRAESSVILSPSTEVTCRTCGESVEEVAVGGRCDDCEWAADAESARLRGLTPMEFDVELSALMAKADAAESRLQRAVDEVHRAVGDRTDQFGRWRTRERDAIAAARQLADVDLEADENWEGRVAARALAKHAEAEDVMAALRQEHQVRDKEFSRRGGWPRAFLASSSDGHVHSTTQCSTCNKGAAPTSFQWMTDYSGQGENQIVEAAGWRACTVCYPTAPGGDATSRPSQMRSTEDEGREAARAERDAKRSRALADKVAKGLTPDGSEFEVRWVAKNAPGWDRDPDTGRRDHVYRDRPETERFKTERTAVSWYVNVLATGWGADDKKPALDAIVEALAAKRGVDVESVRAELATKVEAKRRRG